MSQLPMVSTRQRRHLGNFGPYFTERKALAKPTSTENRLIFVRCAQQPTRRRYQASCCEMWPRNNIVCKITNKPLVITSPMVICQSQWARDIDTCRKRSSTILWESGLSKSAGEPSLRKRGFPRSPSRSSTVLAHTNKYTIAAIGPRTSSDGLARRQRIQKTTRKTHHPRRHLRPSFLFPLTFRFSPLLSPCRHHCLAPG